MVVGASKIARDISDRKRAEQQAGESGTTRRVPRRSHADADQIARLRSDAASAGSPRRAIPRRLLRLRCGRPRTATRRASRRRTSCRKKRSIADVTSGAFDDHETAWPVRQRVIRTRNAVVDPRRHRRHDRRERARRRGTPRATPVAGPRRRIMCVPMVAHDRTLGAMTLATAESGRHFSRRRSARRSGPGDARGPGDRDRAVVPAAAERQPSEGRISRDAVARAAHAAERGARLCADAAVGRHRRRESSAGARSDRSQRRRAGADRRGCARRLAHRPRQGEAEEWSRPISPPSSRMRSRR